MLEKFKQRRKLIVATTLVVTYLLLGTALLVGSGGSALRSEPISRLLFEIVTWPKYIYFIVKILRHGF